LESSLPALERLIAMDWSDSTNFRRPLLPDLSAGCRKAQALQTGWPTFVGHLFPSDQHYDRFDGIKLTPWNKAYIDPGFVPVVSPFGEPRVVGLAQFDASALEYHFCSVADIDGGVWHVDKVGPFHTKGNRSWWQFSGRDLMKLSSQLAANADGKLFITETFTGPVDMHGKFIPLPTLHIHHVHVFNSRQDVPASVPIHPQYMYATADNNYIIEHHSESAYNDADGSVHSVGPPSGYGLLIGYPLDATLEFNDYRAASAPTVTFYLQIAAKVFPPTSQLTPVSFLAPLPGIVGMKPIWGHQLGFGNRWCDTRCVMWSTQTAPFSCTVIALKHHSHLSVLHREYLIAADAIDLGLFARDLPPPFFPEVPGLFEQAGPVAQKLANGRRMVDTLTMHLDETGFSSFTDFENNLLAVAGNRLRCVVTPVSMRVDGVITETFGNQTCTFDLPWTLAKGDVHTVVALQQPSSPNTPYMVHATFMHSFAIYSFAPASTCQAVPGASEGFQCLSLQGRARAEERASPPPVLLTAMLTAVLLLARQVEKSRHVCL